MNVPEGWREVLIDAVARRGSGHTPNKNVPEYWNGGIKWISLADSSKLDNRFIAQTDKEISDLGVKNSSAVIHKKGTVLLSRDAGVGKSAIMSEDMAVSQHFITWTCNERDTHNIFVYYWLQHNKTTFEKIAVGSTIKTIGLPYFKKLRLFLPPLPEQRKIAAILSTWDDSLSTLTRLIATKRQQKRALAEQLLTGQRRLKGFEGEWKREKLYKYVMRTKGRIVATNKLGRGVPYIGAKSFGGEFGDYTDDPNAVFCQADDILILWDGEYAGNSTTRLEGAVSSTVARLRLSEEVNSIFLQACLQKDIGLIRDSRTGSGIPHMPSDFEKWYEILLPPLPEQRAIAAILSTLDHEISALERLKTSVQEQKRGLMDALLTGRVRVNVKDA